MTEGSIYLLKCPLTEAVKYVGQSINVDKRFRLHLYHSKTGKARTHKEKWINSLISKNLLPQKEIVWTGNASLLDRKEIEFIALFKSFGAKLTNATTGGKTTSGRKCSEETKSLMSRLMAGRYLRPPMTQQEKDALSLRKTGTKQTQEAKDKISAARKGKPSFWTHNEMPQAYKELAAINGRLCAKRIVAIKDGVEVLYNSQMEASQATKCDRKTIRMVAEGIYKQCKGYSFKFSSL